MFSSFVTLEKEDFEGFKSLIKASGDSSFKYLQNVYSVKNLSRQEMAVGLAFSDVILKGRGVSRVYGGGFAGTIQAFVPNDIVDIYKKNMEDIFGQDNPPFCYYSLGNNTLGYYVNLWYDYTV